ncbi:hypothetical protein BN11_1520012 [Nostocoides australiense Ben110]|uniref:D-inositol 3-phosphate glycosyltransferase n=1 Tax=Nostocoides australiense Ben110 TaxID=1193182 RepID=W6K1W0_9MICO|nr:glycosyltransferase [Tetrasphaera australiensis]CCH72299.1 hypothetical protein BN11_1520012 [Tetrasphaera australiensis Ben110]
MAPPQRVRVLTLIKGLGPGGAEQLLLLAMRTGDHGRFEHRIRYLRPDKTHLVTEFEEVGVTPRRLGADSTARAAWLRDLRTELAAADVVHVHSPVLASAARVAVWTLPKRQRPAIVATEHNEWTSHRLPTRLANAATAWTDTASWAVSEPVRETIWAPLRRRSRVLVHGIDTTDSRSAPSTREAARAELGIAPDEILAVTVANLRRNKDYPNLLQAARFAVDAEPRLRFAAVGQGPLLEQTTARRDQLALGDHFQLLGYRRDVHRILAAADIFVLGSAHEGLPVAVMEAFAAGLPVVATRVGGVPGQVREGREGLLVSPGDPQALADALLTVAGDGHLRAELSRAARARASAYDIRMAVTAHEAAYAQAARGAPRLVHLTTVDMSLALLLATELVTAREAGYDVFGISSGGPYAPRIEALGVTHVPLPSLTRTWNPRADTRAFVDLVRILRRLRPEVLHTHNPKTGVMGRLAGRIAGVPVVVNTCHGLWARPGDPLLRRAFVYGLEAAAVRCSDYELFQNAEDERTMRRVLKPGRHQVVGNGIDLEHFHPDPGGRERLRTAWGVGPDELVVGTVGRRVLEKGDTEFSAAARALGHRARFVWVGPEDDTAGPPPRRDPAVRYAGEHTDMPAVYSAFDVFVLASYREGFSRAAMEAAACGCAMVLTDIRGCREIGTDGEHVLFVPPVDSPALIRALTRVLDDPGLRITLGAAARERAMSTFDQRGVAAVSLETYRAVLVRRTIRRRR